MVCYWFGEIVQHFCAMYELYETFLNFAVGKLRFHFVFCIMLFFIPAGIKCRHTIYLKDDFFFFLMEKRRCEKVIVTISGTWMIHK